MKRQTRIEQLRRKLYEEAEAEISKEDAQKIVLGEMPYPQTVQVIINCELTHKYRRSDKICPLNTGVSDPVFKLLPNIKSQIGDLVWGEELDRLQTTKDKIDIGDELRIDCWVTHMEKYTDKLLGLLQHRAMLGFPEDNFTMEELYNYLYTISKLSESETKTFILKQIPRASWDGELEIQQ